MSDADVQDVRDLVATQTAEARRNQQLFAHIKNVAAQAESAPQTDKEKERQDRDRRLGLPARPTAQTIAAANQVATQLR
ncbi:hypothetical protein FIBSPDRAFT_846471 [Athelia psychrophila]|uniref:Uncharacterized protein n=1 Tax=Athelia psychrophila TaxID=1759441 RepID=A0A166X2P8_9AGAM|nr:hypothetical protein FIBSPDRAFT_846471 [Fibularhizoctonia sp. CBS 109695]